MARIAAAMAEVLACRVKTRKHTRRSTQHRRFKHKQKKRTCLSRNWREYSAAIVQRFVLTLWVEQEVQEALLHAERSGR